MIYRPTRLPMAWSCSSRKFTSTAVKRALPGTGQFPPLLGIPPSIFCAFDGQICANSPLDGPLLYGKIFLSEN